jgi:hypothetical protein
MKTVRVTALTLGLCAAAWAAEPSAGVKLWVEAEAYAEQRGSTAPRYAMKGASGGFIVDR